MFSFFRKNKKAEAPKNAFESAWSDFREWVSPYRASSGVPVTYETAKTSAAAYACKRLISETVSLMPVPVYQREKNGDRTRVEHDIWWLLNESPWPSWTSAQFFEYMIDCKLMHGDGFAYIHRNQFNEVTGIEPLDPKKVVPFLAGKYLGYSVDGVVYDQSKILHFAGYGFNGLRGESVIQHAARNAIGAGIAADNFSGEFFKNGAVPSIIISYPQGVAPTKDQQEALRQQIEDRYVGDGNRHRPFILTNGAGVEPVSINASDAQLIETRRYQVVDICRAFGVPPDFIGENQTSAWGTGLEQRMIGFVRTVINPHARKMEQELNRKLWPRSIKYFVEFNREGLMAGDSKSEAEYFKAALGGPGAQGWMKLNEVRKIKNLPPVDGGESVHMAAQQKAQPDEDKKFIEG